MVRERVVEEEELATGGAVGAVALHRVLRDAPVARAVGVVDVHVAAVGRERGAEEALLARVLHQVGDVEHRCRVELAPAQRPHTSRLLSDVERVVAASDRDRERLHEPRHRCELEHPLALRGDRRPRCGAATLLVVARARGGEQRDDDDTGDG